MGTGRGRVRSTGRERTRGVISPRFRSRAGLDQLSPTHIVVKMFGYEAMPTSGRLALRRDRATEPHVSKYESLVLDICVLHGIQPRTGLDVETADPVDIVRY